MANIASSVSVKRASRPSEPATRAGKNEASISADTQPVSKMSHIELGRITECHHAEQVVGQVEIAQARRQVDQAYEVHHAARGTHIPDTPTDTPRPSARTTSPHEYTPSCLPHPPLPRLSPNDSPDSSRLIPRPVLPDTRSSTPFASRTCFHLRNDATFAVALSLTREPPSPRRQRRGP